MAWNLRFSVLTIVHTPQFLTPWRSETTDPMYNVWIDTNPHAPSKEHTSKPYTFAGQAVVKNIFFRERSNLMDHAALEDAETSLKNMLRDFLEDSKIVPEHLR